MGERGRKAPLPVEVLDWNAAAIRFYEGLEMRPAWRRMRINGAAVGAMAREDSIQPQMDAN
jgi:hypothetical protein